MPTNKVVLTNVRLSYVTVFEPRASMPGAEPKYSVSIIIDKSDTANLAKIKQGLEDAKQYGIANKWGGKLPANLKTPLKDGAVTRPGDELYGNAFYLEPRSKTKPQILDVDKHRITASEQDKIYSGIYGHVSVTFYPYDTSGNRGIGVGLGNIMKTADGEPLSGNTTAESDFADIAAAEPDTSWI